MLVTVVDRTLQDMLWGNGYRSINQIIRSVEISDTCPVCGGKRGKPQLVRYCEDGEWYNVSRWENPCSHLDTYANVLLEAATMPGGSGQ